MIVSEAGFVPRVPKKPAHTVDVRLRVDAGPRRRLRDLVAVLVRAGEREDLPAAGPPEASQHVGYQRDVRVAEVRLGIYVEERRGDVEPLLRHPDAARRAR